MPKGYTGSRSFSAAPVTWLLADGGRVHATIEKAAEHDGGLRVKSFPTGEDPQRRPRRPRRRRQDHAGRGAAATAPARSPASGRVEDGTTVCDFDPEEQRSAASRCRSPLAPFECEGPQGQPDRHARLRRLRRRRRTPRCGSPTSRSSWSSAVEGVEVQTEVVVAAWPPSSGCPRMIFVNKLDRERAASSARSTSCSDKFGAGVAPLELPDRRGGRVPRRRRPAHRHGATSTTDGTATDGRDPRRHGDAGAPGARQPRRGHRGRPTTT